jgi:hypothetical protein
MNNGKVTIGRLGYAPHIVDSVPSILCPMIILWALMLAAEFTCFIGNYCHILLERSTRIQIHNLNSLISETISCGGTQDKDDFIRIKGAGKPPSSMILTDSQKYLLARRAAITDSYRKALIYLNKTDKINTDLDPYQTIHISGKLTGARIIETRYMADGIVEVTITIPRQKRKT